MYEWIIVDGNNLIHSDRDNLFGNRRADFDLVRRALARSLDELVGELAQRVTVVYDGTVGGRDEAFQTSELQVVFSAAETSADSIIERMVADARAPETILVVSSDRGERDTVGAAGARTMSCENFIELVKDTRKAMERRLSSRRRRSAEPSLGDFFPKNG